MASGNFLHEDQPAFLQSDIYLGDMYGLWYQSCKKCS
jgi:hypothetical protein